jgi:hypothetical protein
MPADPASEHARGREAYAPMRRRDVAFYVLLVATVALVSLFRPVDWFLFVGTITSVVVWELTKLRLRRNAGWFADGPDPTTARPQARLYLIGALLLAGMTIVSSVGWFLSAREGRGIPALCYSLLGESEIGFQPDHGSNTLRATFAVAEDADRVMLGYWEEVSGGMHTAEAYGSSLTYQLVRPLGDRRVVDPAGDPIPTCG